MITLADLPRIVVMRGKVQEPGTVSPWGQGAQKDARGHFATMVASATAKSQLGGGGSQTLSGYVASSSTGYRGGVGSVSGNKICATQPRR